MIFDTDMMIEIERGNAAVMRMFDAQSDRGISAQTWMELIKGARSKEHLRQIKSFIAALDVEVLPFDQGVSHRAMAIFEDHYLKDGISIGDSMIAATALQRGWPLCTMNRKHFRPIRGLELVGPKG